MLVSRFAYVRRLVDLRQRSARRGHGPMSQSTKPYAAQARAIDGEGKRLWQKDRTNWSGSRTRPSSIRRGTHRRRQRFSRRVDLQRAARRLDVRRLESEASAGIDRAKCLISLKGTG